VCKVLFVLTVEHVLNNNEQNPSRLCVRVIMHTTVAMETLLSGFIFYAIIIIGLYFSLIPLITLLRDSQPCYLKC
jgi:hypothetical protein